MPRGAPALKLAITVDRDVHAKVVRAAKAEHISISAWMTAAARRSLLVRDGLAAIAEWEAAHGALSEEELDAARARVFGPKPRPRTRGPRTWSTRPSSTLPSGGTRRSSRRIRMTSAGS
jgi:hypothetical protein